MNKLIMYNISKKFDNEQVLNNVNMYLEKEEIVSIIGESGCGKSTLFNLIVGLIPYDSGKILLDDKELINPFSHISYMLQKDLLINHKTVFDNISLPLILKKENKDKIREKVNKYLKIFSLDHLKDKYPKELSGGQKQRVALLRTYLCDKEIILLDEPFSALDSLTRENIRNWFIEIKEKLKLSAILVTHDIDEAIFLSNRIYVLEKKYGGSSIVKEFKINLDYPRNILSKEYLTIKNEIYSYIHDKSNIKEHVLL